MSTFHYSLIMMSGIDAHSHAFQTHYAFHHHLPLLRRVHQHWLLAALLSIAFMTFFRGQYFSQVATEMSDYLRHMSDCIRHVGINLTRQAKSAGQECSDMRQAGTATGTQAARIHEETVEELAGRRIRDGREALGISQARLARETGVDRKTVIQWEKGRNLPRDKRQVATVLHKKLEFLFAEDADLLKEPDRYDLKAI